MDRETVEHIRRAAASAQSLRIEPDASIKFTFRAMDIFARLVTPEKVEELCDEVLSRIDADWTPSDSEVAQTESLVEDAERFRMACSMNFISRSQLSLIDRAVADANCESGSGGHDGTPA